MTASRKLETRRSTYRVRPRSVHELDLALLEKRYKVIRGTVTDITASGAQVHFERGSIPALVPGARIMLALASDVYDFDGTLWAFIVSSTEQGNEHIVRFAFDPDNAALKPADQAFFSLFNRRAGYRRSEHGEPSPLRGRVAPATAAGGDGSPAFPAAIRDISNNGVCFSVTASADHVLQGSPALTLELRLPAGTAPHRLACHHRRRVATHDSALYACEFDWSATAEAAAASEELMAYVIERFADDMRISPDRRMAR